MTTPPAQQPTAEAAAALALVSALWQELVAQNLLRLPDAQAALDRAAHMANSFGGARAEDAVFGLMESLNLLRGLPGQARDPGTPPPTA